MSDKPSSPPSARPDATQPGKEPDKGPDKGSGASPGRVSAVSPASAAATAARPAGPDAGKPAERPLARFSERAAERAADKPSGSPADKISDKAASRPDERSPGRPADHPADRPADRSGDRPPRPSYGFAGRPATGTGSETGKAPGVEAGKGAGGDAAKAAAAPSSSPPSPGVATPAGTARPASAPATPSGAARPADATTAKPAGATPPSGAQSSATQPSGTPPSGGPAASQAAGPPPLHATVTPGRPSSGMATPPGVSVTPAPRPALPPDPYRAAAFAPEEPIPAVGAPRPVPPPPPSAIPRDAAAATAAALEGPQLDAALEPPVPQAGIPDMRGLDPADVDYTPPLIECMSFLFRLHGKPVSTRFLIAGLPMTDGPVHPSACIRAARTAGMASSVVYRPTLDRISSLTLPCILLLRQEKACVLLSLQGDKAEVLFPETGMEPRMVPVDELTKEYTGYAMFARLEGKLDRRASEIKLLKAKRWFWDTLLHFLPIYKHVLFASVVVNLLTIVSPLFFMNVYDRVVPNSATETLWVLAIGIGIAYVFDFLLRNLRSYFVDVAGRNADIVLASRLMNQLMSLRLDAKPDSTGSLANNLREFESLREFFGSTTLLALVDLPFLVLFVLIVCFIGGPIGVVPMLAVPIVVGIGMLLQLPFQRLAEAGYKEGMQKNALLVEIINGLETVKSSLAEGRMQHAWEKVVGMSASSNAHTKGLANISVTMSILFTQLVSVTVIIWGVYRISDGLLTMGGLIACNMLASRAMAPLSQVAAMLARLQQSRMALKSLDMLMNLPTERPEDRPYVDFGPLEHSIVFESVSFAYPGSERLALENVNMTIRPGERVGVIGRMGSGKSTMGRLAIGLYQPRDGAVRFGGVDIRQMDMADLRSRVGYLAQDNYLFYGSVRDNIAIGVPNADDRMILRAATIAGVVDFVRGHPAGFGMPVGERGMALSGGQRQAVALARSLLHDPDVLILDEPSSNMDNSSEMALKRRLAEILGKKTLILVTHRVSMLDLVDRLVVLDHGKVVADGPKQAVLAALRGDQVRAAGAARFTGAPAAAPRQG
ncbi:type I secretion system permease/ATPase [Nitratidesulfovibrio sp. HK-II]|nr:type I secretion system ATPase [Nitratidesulfovibrio sp. HK-II]